MHKYIYLTSEVAAATMWWWVLWHLISEPDHITVSFALLNIPDVFLIFDLFCRVNFHGLMPAAGPTLNWVFQTLWKNKFSNNINQDLANTLL